MIETYRVLVASKGFIIRPSDLTEWIYVSAGSQWEAHQKAVRIFANRHNISTRYVGSGLALLVPSQSSFFDLMNVPTAATKGQ